MKILKTIFNKNFKTLFVISTTLIFSIVLLMIRIKLNRSYFFLFLVWNVFLASIPYAITMCLNTIKLNKYRLLFWFCIWLLFLPNAPYIITDLLHLRVSTSSMLWLDILVILSFAFSGLLLYYLSLIDMITQIEKHFKKAPINLITTTIIILCGFGVYLGRFLRYNSWEIFNKPQQLLSHILDMVMHPNLHSEVWLFTFGFGGFLLIGFWVFKNSYFKPST